MTPSAFQVEAWSAVFPVQGKGCPKPLQSAARTAVSSHLALQARTEAYKRDLPMKWHESFRVTHLRCMSREGGKISRFTRAISLYGHGSRPTTVSFPGILPSHPPAPAGAEKRKITAVGLYLWPEQITS